MTKRWYIVHAYSNFESKVAEAIQEQAKRQGLDRLFEEVVVPTERVVEVRRGRKFESDRKLFPGLRVRQDGNDRCGPGDDQEYAEGDGLPRPGQQAAADLRQPKRRRC